ncbi:MAG: hypothetical protein ACLFQV_04985 [Vulcanimicrobiota bacterium]
MIFIYDRKIANRYLLFGAVMIGIALALSSVILVFLIPVLISMAILGYFGLGALIRASSIYNHKIILDNQGIQFLKGKKIIKTIKWKDIDGIAVSEMSLKLKVGENFENIDKELKEFDKFEQVVRQQVAMPLVDRGMNLPGLDSPQLGMVVREHEINEEDFLEESPELTRDKLSKQFEDVDEASGEDDDVVF